MEDEETDLEGGSQDNERMQFFSSDPTVRLLVQLRSGEQRLIASSKSIITIGRLPQNEIHLDDPLVSRKHAEIYRDQNGYWLRDLGSRNGTFLNGEPITAPTRLKPGDAVNAGNCLIVFEPPTQSLLKDRQENVPFSTMSLARPKVPKLKAPLEMLTTVSEIARRIVMDLPLEQTLQSILEICLERTAGQRAAILLVDEASNLIPKAYLSKSPTRERFALSRSIARRAIAANEAVLIRDVAGEHDLKASESIANLKIRSAICTPLWNGENTVGVLYIDTTQSDHQFDEVDLLFFSTLSGMIAEKIQNAMLAEIAKEKQRLDAELRIAAQIQRQLLPSSLPEIEGYDFAAFNRACTEIGGDYCDIFPIDDRITVAIADVAGKGIGAAMLMSNLQAAVRIRSSASDTAELLSNLNRDLLPRVGEGRFITCFFMSLNPETGKIAYANAGHNPPIHIRSDGSIEDLKASGLPLGILPESSYEARETTLARGDIILLYSDGITECLNENDELYSEERLIKTLKQVSHLSVQEISRAILASLDEFRNNRPFSDDVTFVLLKRL